MNYVYSFIIGYSIPVLGKFSIFLFGIAGVALLNLRLLAPAPLTPLGFYKLYGIELLRWPPLFCPWLLKVLYRI